MTQHAAPTIRILALTDAGHRLAQRLSQFFDRQGRENTVWFKPKPFAETLQNAFAAGEPLVLICATGIAVRTLAPVLVDKHEDPPVLVLDEQGAFVIPLLSGHEGGANEWGRTLANFLSAQLAMTTANPYLKPVYSVGMGCERHCPEQYLQQLLDQCLADAGLTIDQISAITSIDLKADEVALIALAERVNKPFVTFDKTTLAGVEHLLSTKSEYVYNTVGVYGVAESAALIHAQQLTQQTSELILNKQKNAKATCAIARAYPQLSGDTC